MPTKYLEEFLLKVVHRYEDGASIPELHQAFNIAISTAYWWIKTHRTIQTTQHPAFRTILSKSGAYPVSSPPKKANYNEKI